MNINNMKRSQSPPLADPSRPSKHQKPNISEAELELERLQEENELLHTKLSLIVASKATVNYLHNVRNEIQEIIEKERNVVLLQRQLDEQTISQLEEDLETLSRNNCDAREAEVTAEMKYSKLQEEMRIFTMKVQGELNSANVKIIELEGKLVESQMPDYKCIELDGDEVPRFNSGGRKVLEVVGKQQSYLGHKSSLRNAEKGNNFQKRLDEVESLKQVRMWTEDCVELPLNFCQYISNDTFSASMEYEPSSHQPVIGEVRGNYELWSQDNDLQREYQKTTSMAAGRTSSNYGNLPALNYDDFSSGESSETCPSLVRQFDDNSPGESSGRYQEDLKIKVGRNLFVLASDPLFFRLNWSNEYTCRKKNGLICNQCNFVAKNKENMEDHVFVEHFNGAFQCPKCSCTFKWRTTVVQHDKRAHCLSFVYI